MNLALSVLNEACMLSSAALIAFGWRAVRHRQLHLHRRLMLLGTLFGALFFITYVIKSLFIGDTLFGGPKSMAAAYGLFLQVHVTLATLAAIAGVITLRWAFRQRFAKHRRLAPYTAVGWLIAAGTGLVVFLLLYVIYPSGPTTNVLRAVTHG